MSANMDQIMDRLIDQFETMIEARVKLQAAVDEISKSSGYDTGGWKTHFEREELDRARKGLRRAFTKAVREVVRDEFIVEQRPRPSNDGDEG